jgi:hypothetical protein
MATVSQDNIEIVRSGFERFFQAGEEQWEMLDPEIEIYDHDLPDAGSYRGRDGFIQWGADWGEPWEEWSFEPEEYIDVS